MVRSISFRCRSLIIFHLLSLCLIHHINQQTFGSNPSFLLSFYITLFNLPIPVHRHWHSWTRFYYSQWFISHVIFDECLTVKAFVRVMWRVELNYGVNCLLTTLFSLDIEIWSVEQEWSKYSNKIIISLILFSYHPITTKFLFHMFYICLQSVNNNIVSSLLLQCHLLFSQITSSHICSHLQ